MNIEKKIIRFMKSKNLKFYAFIDIIKAFPRSVNSKMVSLALNNLKKSGVLIEKNSKFGLIEAFDYKIGEITRINSTFGFAKLIFDESPKNDIDFVNDLDKENEAIENEPVEVFIPGRFLLGAMVGDKVVINIFRKADENNRSDTAEVISIANFNSSEFSGVLIREGVKYFVVSDDLGKFPIFVSNDDLNGAKINDKVLACITKRGSSHSNHQAKIVKVFGDSSFAKNSCIAYLESNKIKTEFNDTVLKNAQFVSSSESTITADILKSRTDLRSENIFTIDSADTKDIDDAISIEKVANGWSLGVHIADVSHFVESKSPLDNEAFERATSIYYAASVIPMLPKELSNGVCSLNPNEDRLAFSCLINLDSNGNILNYEFKKTVINSKIKGVYKEINSILDKSANDEIKEKYSDLTGEIEKMDELAKILNKNRFNRGGLNLDSTESKIIIDSEGIVTDIKQRTRGVCETIIEEFMLIANQCAANFAKKINIPFVYRVHENPPEGKLETLKLVLLSLGFTGIKDNINQLEMAKILNASKGTSRERVVNNQILRSMAKAKYSEIPAGHFGLVLEDYAHFTSPIRRYPDLIIHRILSAVIEEKIPIDSVTKKFKNFVKKAALQSTNQEIVAMQCERNCEDFYKAEYIKRYIGEEFEAVITGVTAFGLYAELENTIEGLCRIENLPKGEYLFDGSINLKETLSGKNYCFGDEIKIKVISADVNSGKIDFALC